MRLALLGVSAVSLCCAVSPAGGAASNFVVGSAARLQARHARSAPQASRAAAAAPAALEAPVQRQRRRTPRGNATLVNATLLLGGGRDTPFSLGATFGAQWSQCHASYTDAERGHVLERWVLPDAEASVISFNTWRQGGRPGSTDVRCGRTALAGQDVMCLECVSPFQLTGSTPLGGGSAGAGLFGTLRQCMAMSMGTGFCKTGSVSVPAA